ncbi:hypothetical protein, partial [Akkermansia sp.]
SESLQINERISPQIFFNQHLSFFFNPGIKSMHRNIFFSGFPIRSQAVTLRGKNLQCRSFTYQGLLRGIEICLGSLVFDENTENFYDIWA